MVLAETCSPWRVTTACASFGEGQDRDGATAQRVVQDLVGLMEHDTMAHPTAAVRFQTLNPPTIPGRLGPKVQVATVALGYGIGLAVGALRSWRRRRLRA